MSILQQIIEQKKKAEKSIAVLVDPDEINSKDCARLALELSQFPISMLLVGGSFLRKNQLTEVLTELKANTDIPLVLFPGNEQQISSVADGILLLSLISGRNPDFLIGKHVIAAPQIKAAELEVISTGYMLVESGKLTSVHYMSGTLPLPNDKPEIAQSTAMAGEMLGMKFIYLEAGSGALQPVPTEMISAVSASIRLPLLVGGGIRNAGDAEAAFKSGADIVVIGNALERKSTSSLLSEITEKILILNKNVFS